MNDALFISVSLTSLIMNVIGVPCTHSAIVPIYVHSTVEPQCYMYMYLPSFFCHNKFWFWKKIALKFDLIFNCSIHVFGNNGLDYFVGKTYQHNCQCYIELTQINFDFKLYTFNCLYFNSKNRLCELVIAVWEKFCFEVEPNLIILHLWKA